MIEWLKGRVWMFKYNRRGFWMQTNDWWNQQKNDTRPEVIFAIVADALLALAMFWACSAVMLSWGY